MGLGMRCPRSPDLWLDVLLTSDGLGHSERRIWLGFGFDGCWVLRNGHLVTKPVGFEYPSVSLDFVCAMSRSRACAVSHSADRVT